ncbi:hypothetical protein BC832DRAFT_303731 [Gaertneriomyces semiglobifer]|nr:hypothetical protein BC832DRAFT_303731 [Gaertneriomyces semiglobifer]
MKTNIRFLPNLPSTEYIIVITEAAGRRSPGRRICDLILLVTFHLRTVHSEKKYNCNDCGRSYSRKDSLTRHSCSAKTDLSSPVPSSSLSFDDGTAADLPGLVASVLELPFPTPPGLLHPFPPALESAANSASPFGLRSVPGDAKIPSHTMSTVEMPAAASFVDSLADKVAQRLLTVLRP